MVEEHKGVLEKKACYSKALDALSEEMAAALEQARVKAEEDNKAAQTRLQETLKENERLKTQLQVSSFILVLVQ